MAGAEGQARLDPHRDHAMRHLARIMRAIDKEASRPHRRQAFLAEANPVLVGQGLDGDLAAGDARQLGGIGFFRIQSFHHGAGTEGLFRDQDGLRIGRQLQQRRHVRRFGLGQRDGCFPEGG